MRTSLRIAVVGLLLIFPALLRAQNKGVPLKKDTVTAVEQLLTLSLEELMDLKVSTATGYSQPASEAPATIRVITSAQIIERGYDQLEDALRDVPGIDMIHINGYAPTLIYFRGMYGAENLRALIMIDGIAENNILGSNDMAGPAYSLHNIERIEIIWGPVSALYGANAFGGVINMITKKGGDMNGLHAEAGFGSFNTTLQQLRMGVKNDHYEWSVSGSLYSTDGPVFANRDPKYSASYVDKAYGINTMLSLYGKNSKTTLGYRTYKTPMGWGTYSNSPTTYLGLPAQGNKNSGVIGVMQRDFNGERSGLDDSYLNTFFVEQAYRPSQKLNLLGRFVYRETGIANDSYIYVTVDGNRMIRTGVATYSNRVDGELSANYQISNNSSLAIGVQFFQDNVEKGARKTTYDPNTIWLVDGKDTVVNLNSTYLPRVYDIRNNFGSYAQYILNTTLLTKTSFTAGLRFDNNSYFGSVLSPRLAIVSQPDSKLTFKLMIGRAFRAPTNLEIYQTPPTGEFKLKEEQITTYEVNGIYQWSPSVRTQINLFRNELRDVIILGNLAGLTPDKNPGLININGAEAIFDFLFSQRFSGFVNITGQDAGGENLVTNAKGEVSGVAKFKGNAGVTVTLNELFTLTLSGNWVGSRHTPKTDPYGEVKGYCLGNIVLGSAKLFKGKITSSIIVRNFLNTAWLDPGFRTADGLLYSTVLEQPGRTFLFKIGVIL